MSETAEFDIGSEVTCRDGVCGEVDAVVVDPVARAITHLVVTPRPHEGRLVPITQVASAGSPIRLTCTKAQFETFERAEEMQLLPAANGQLGYDRDHVLALPYYGLRIGSRGTTGLPLMGTGAHRHVTVHDRVPVGEVEIRRGDHVHAADGNIGRVEGLVVDPADHHVTHFLLQEGHLWGQKTVAIPIGAVTRVEDGVRLSLTKDQVRDLPSVDVDPPQ